jgi:hypothetical protein
VKPPCLVVAVLFILIVFMGNSPAHDVLTGGL